MPLRRLIGHISLLLLIQGIGMILLHFPEWRNGSLHDVSEKELAFHWVHPSQTGSTRVSAKFTRSCLARLVVFKAGHPEEPFWISPYLQPKAQSLFILSIPLSDLDPHQAYVYQWEVKQKGALTQVAAHGYMPSIPLAPPKEEQIPMISSSLAKIGWSIFQPPSPL